jgi:hypothetical protein
MSMSTSGDAERPDWKAVARQLSNALGGAWHRHTYQCATQKHHACDCGSDDALRAFEAAAEQQEALDDDA